MSEDNKPCINRLVQNERTKCFRMLRNCRDDKIEMKKHQIDASEAMLRLAIMFSETSSFRSIDK